MRPRTLLLASGLAMALVACLSKPDRVAGVDAGRADAAGGVCDANRCGSKSGTCVGAVCVIRQGTDGRVECPDGELCRVECVGSDACKTGGVDCKKALGCEVICLGSNACQHGVDCADAPTCKVRCEGTSACQGDGESSVQCRHGSCDVTCEGSTATCQQGIQLDNGATCSSHCCDGACGSNTCPTNDATCP
ncbi:MAG: hypothetical protein H0T79_05375 [Deltaproteobacteria bacterium]|nr:hypothetical protein [Deltaproteobacteria bacterium]